MHAILDCGLPPLLLRSLTSSDLEAGRYAHYPIALEKLGLESGGFQIVVRAK